MALRVLETWYKLGGIGCYLAMSAALNAAADTIMVCGEPFFLEADHSFVELTEKASRNIGRFLIVLDCFHDEVSRIALTERSSRY